MHRHELFKIPTDDDELADIDDDMVVGVIAEIEQEVLNESDSDDDEYDLVDMDAPEPHIDGRGSSNVSSCSDDSFDPNAVDSDSDDSMYDAEKTADGATNAKRRKEQVTNDANRASGSGTSGGAADLTHLDEDDETDETVRAIIAAIKKPRSAPPEIKLEDFITDICFHPERDIIALATIIGDVHLYEYSNKENKLLRSIEVHAKSCRDVEFSEDGRSLITCSKDKCVMVTDMETEKLKKLYETAHDDAINKIHVLDERLFATGDDAGTVKLWDLRTKDAIFELKEVEDQITQILTNDENKLLLATSADGYLTTYNIGARKLYVQSEPYEEELNCMGIYRGSSKLVAGTSKGRLYTYNWGYFGYHCDMYPGIKSPISLMVPITDRIACVAGEDGNIRACHIAPYRNLGVVGQHNMPIESMDISNNGELLASSSHNNDVRFWNVKYFEDFADIKYNEKHNAYKDKRHNLPSSKCTNVSDFFADMTKENDDDDDDDTAGGDINAAM
ncbi:WD repeat-containing protein 55 homolog isoform X2 [Drosophila busckii]|uniref:WD repeat-containing protein 55 homolog isoform X2 n=1 Tax=Drosophila busckii TaxID=30019 RepID=UPI00083EBD48|nr:WD repeat-containing protein 55 homolog isoform X2 [Drosophila busckii]